MQRRGGGGATARKHEGLPVSEQPREIGAKFRGRRPDGVAVRQVFGGRCSGESPSDPDIAAFKIPLDIGSPPFDC
jgi:hypothetical protein